MKIDEAIYFPCNGSINDRQGIFQSVLSNVNDVDSRKFLLHQLQLIAVTNIENTEIPSKKNFYSPERENNISDSAGSIYDDRSDTLIFT